MKKILLLPFLALAVLSCTTPKTQEPMQNEVINAIMSRRSIRQYHQIPVGRDTIMQIMTCGINAANGQNKQSWEVRIIDNPTTMQQVQDLMAAGNPALPAEMVRGCMRGAPVMTFIARDKGYDFSAYDCGLLAGNMITSAKALGIGSVCLGGPVMFMKSPAAKPYLEKLALPEGYQLQLAIGFGYPAENPEARPRDPEKVKWVE